MYPESDEHRDQIRLTLAHESMHMQNFYRRAVLMGEERAFDAWLEEGSAVMVEDFVSEAVAPGRNEVRDARVPAYLANGLYSCGLTMEEKADSPCDVYAVAGSFGGFLNRQLGMPFYKQLLRQGGNASTAGILDAAIRASRPASGLAQEFRHWTATMASLMPATLTPPGYGYPGRADIGFPLPAVDLQAFAARRQLPAAPPALLPGYSAFPVVRHNVTGVYRETIKVPPRTTLQVVVHQGKA